MRLPIVCLCLVNLNTTNMLCVCLFESTFTHTRMKDTVKEPWREIVLPTFKGIKSKRLGGPKTKAYKQILYHVRQICDHVSDDATINTEMYLLCRDTFVIVNDLDNHKKRYSQEVRRCMPVPLFAYCYKYLYIGKKHRTEDEIIDLYIKSGAYVKNEVEIDTLLLKEVSEFIYSTMRKPVYQAKENVRPVIREQHANVGYKILNVIPPPTITATTSYPFVRNPINGFYPSIPMYIPKSAPANLPPSFVQKQIPRIEPKYTFDPPESIQQESDDYVYNTAKNFLSLCKVVDYDDLLRISDECVSKYRNMFPTSIIKLGVLESALYRAIKDYCSEWDENALKKKISSHFGIAAEAIN